MHNSGCKRILEVYVYKGESIMEVKHIRKLLLLSAPVILATLSVANGKTYAAESGNDNAVTETSTTEPEPSVNNSDSIVTSPTESVPTFFSESTSTTESGTASTTPASTDSPAPTPNNEAPTQPEFTEGNITFHGPRMLGPDIPDPYTRTKAVTDKLELPENYAGRSSWTYRTARSFFIGWSTVPSDQFTGSTDQPLYRDGTLVKTVLQEQNKKDVDLYAIYVNQNEALSLASKLTGKIDINKNMTEDQAIPESDKLLEKTDTYAQNDAHKKVVVKFDKDKANYSVVFSSHFTFDNKKVSGAIAENPTSINKEAKAGATFKGVDPGDFSYVDLEVGLDSRATTAKEMKNVTFKSALFMVRAVLDENYNVLKTLSEDELPKGEVKEQVFNFNNPDRLTKFIFRTTIRNFGEEYKPSAKNPYSSILSDEKYVHDMELSSGDKNNIQISKEVASEIVDKGTELTFSGAISGKAKGSIDFRYFKIPVNKDIKRQESRNTVDVSFKRAYKVKYQYTNESLPDSVKETLPEEMKVINGADIVKGDKITATNPTIKKDGKITETNEVKDTGGKWQFKGWDKTTKTVENGDVVFTGTWEFISEKYHLTYKFESLTADKALPSEVMALLPQDSTIYHLGDSHPIAELETSEVRVEGGKWLFKGYDKQVVEFKDKDEVVTGQWQFEAVKKYEVTHQFVSGTKEKELPWVIAQMTPQTKQIEQGNLYRPTESIVPVETPTGNWVFKGWDKKGKIAITANTHFIGTWEFEDKTAKVMYKFESITPDKVLPKTVEELTPASKVTTFGQKESAMYPVKTEVVVEDGKWVFQGYRTSELVVDEAVEQFIGQWQFEGNPATYKLTYRFESDTTGKNLPNEVTQLLPLDRNLYRTGDVAKAQNPAQSEVVVASGKWIFKGYQHAEITFAEHDEVLVGHWEYTAAEIVPEKPENPKKPEDPKKPEKPEKPKKPEQPVIPTPNDKPTPEVKPMPKSEDKPKEEAIPQTRNVAMPMKEELPNTGETSNTLLFGAAALAILSAVGLTQVSATSRKEND